MNVYTYSIWSDIINIILERDTRLLIYTRQNGPTTVRVVVYNERINNAAKVYDFINKQACTINTAGAERRKNIEDY